MLYTYCFKWKGSKEFYREVIYVEKYKNNSNDGTSGTGSLHILSAD